MSNRIGLMAFCTLALAGNLPVGGAAEKVVPSSTIPAATREIKLAHRYLNFPVKNGAPKRRMSVIVDGNVVREFEIEFADAAPDFWVFLDTQPLGAKVATLKVDKLPEHSAGLSAVDTSDPFKGAENLYREPLRPQFHFSPRRGWNNDPNGMVYFKGEYHLYFQHNPYGWDWGNMHWGHAVSRDLVHWEELPIALYPHRFGDWAFSGSAVVDWKNTGGFQQGKEPALVLAYTSTGRGECIAYSNDKGRTWTEYEGNPVVKHQGRDPRLLWHQPTRKWVMAVYSEFDNKRWIAFHTSPDLKNWEFQSRIEGFYECPDLFELPVQGRRSQRKWVLSGASSEYMLGAFDGRQFIPETPMLAGHRGNAFYAAQTFSDIPQSDGRRIQIGWGRVPTPGMSFNQMMFFPTVMTLRATPEGARLAWAPVEEIRKLRTRSHRWRKTELDENGNNPLALITGELFDISAEIEPRSAKEIRFMLRGVSVVYNVDNQELICADRTNSLPLRNGRLRLRVLQDRTSLEIFADEGLLYVPMAAQAKGGNVNLAISTKGGAALAHSLVVHELSSAWRPMK